MTGGIKTKSIMYEKNHRIISTIMIQSTSFNFTTCLFVVNDPLGVIF